MTIAGSRVGIVGGSIAGCAAAVALRRNGCQVTVYERTAGELEDRGAGIAIPLPLRETLMTAEYLDPDMPVCLTTERVWIASDGVSPAGRVLWRHPFPGAANNWGVLWRTLRSNVPDDSYREGTAVVGCEADPDGATLVLAGGARERFDAVVGADGYRSIVRRAAHPGSPAHYAGYVGWRGTHQESGLRPTDATSLVDDNVATVCYPGGHGIFYFIPDATGGADPGQRRINWVIYTAAPPGAHFEEPGSLPPGSVGPELTGFFASFVDEHLPPAWAEMVRVVGPAAVSLQPVYDRALPSYVSGRVALVGDASTITRPHTASGAVKALSDALALERAADAGDSWEDVLAAYSRERCAAGNDLVELGRRLGRGLVEDTPDWASMTTAAAEAWVGAAFSGSRHYLYDKPARSTSVD